MRLLVDTNTVSYLVKGFPGVRDRLRSAAESGDEILLCPPVHYEFHRYLLFRGATRLQEVYASLAATWVWCPMSRQDWEEAATLWASSSARGRPVGDFDGLITAVARLREAVVVTHNRRHFEELGVGTVDWFESDTTRGA